MINLFASVTAGAIANAVIAPMWTIRTRMMTQNNHEHYRNSFDAAKKIAQTEGLYALYRGLIPSMLGLVSDETNGSIDLIEKTTKIFFVVFRFTLEFNFPCTNI